MGLSKRVLGNLMCNLGKQFIALQLAEAEALHYEY